jgi:hypothetical protein
MQTLADERMGATPGVQSNVSKQCEQVRRHIEVVVFGNTKVSELQGKVGYVGCVDTLKVALKESNQHLDFRSRHTSKCA